MDGWHIPFMQCVRQTDGQMDRMMGKYKKAVNVKGKKTEHDIVIP
jgi:hypothetical protein